MAYQPFYTPTDWQNLPSQKTALNRTNLIHAENGIKEADKRIVDLDAKKVEKSVAELLVKSVVVDTKTGVISVTLLNGTVTTYDLDIERVIANFDITDNNVLVLTLADGTVKEVDLTKFVNSFHSSSTIAMTVRERAVTSEIIDGSITMNKLDAAIQSEFRQYMIEAQFARDSALQYQKFAKRYAIGDSEFEGSEVDNAKYYYEQAKSNAASAASSAQSAGINAETATAQAGIATQKATNAAAASNSAAADAQTAAEKSNIAKQNAEIAIQKAKESADSEAQSKEKAQEALDNANLSKRYAVGGVEPGDDEDNAEYYYNQAKNYAQIAQEVTDIVLPNVYIDMSNGHMITEGGSNFSFYLDNNGHLFSLIGSEVMV